MPLGPWVPTPTLYGSIFLEALLPFLVFFGLRGSLGAGHLTGSSSFSPALQIVLHYSNLKYQSMFNRTNLPTIEMSRGVQYTSSLQYRSMLYTISSWVNSFRERGSHSAKQIGTFPFSRMFVFSGFGLPYTYHSRLGCGTTNLYMLTLRLPLLCSMFSSFLDVSFFLFQAFLVTFPK